MYNENIVLSIIKSINSFYKNRIDHNIINDDRMIMIANEINSANVYDTVFKLVPIVKSTYEDYHYKIDNKYYDVFVFIDEYTDRNRLIQMILCDNYAEIVKFKQDEYNKKKYISKFNLLEPCVYTFYDGEIIVIESTDGKCETGYKEIENPRL